MYDLTILERFEPLSKMPDREAKGNFEFESSAQAELRALLWLTYRPNDIVMLAEPEQKHCHADGFGPCKAGDCPIAGRTPWLGRLVPCSGADGPQHPIATEGT